MEQDKERGSAGISHPWYTHGGAADNLQVLRRVKAKVLAHGDSGRNGIGLGLNRMEIKRTRNGKKLTPIVGPQR